MNTENLISKFFTGINYWGSESAINMWENFNPESIENDFKLLKNAGITHLRVFPLWSVFQPLKALYGPSDVYEYGFGEDSLPDTPAGRAGVSEDACEKFQKFCELAKKYDLKLIVGLITGHMSFRTYTPPAFEGKALLSDHTVMKWQLRFVKYFVSRFKNCSAIVGYDLGNEVKNMPGADDPDTFYVWCSAIADAIKMRDNTRPVISGLDESGIENETSNLKTIGEMCDIHTMHPYNIFRTESDPLCTMKPIIDLAFLCNLSEDISGIPTFVQEFGSIGYMNCSRRTEADFYRACMLTSLAHGCHGVMWWCAFDQGHFGYAPYRWNTIGSDYGFFDKNLNPKPIVEENLCFKERLSHIPNGVLPPHVKNAVILVPRDDGGITLHTLRASYMLAKQANIDVNFAYVMDSIPDSPLYIFPSISSNKSITLAALEQLLDKVRSGAVLFISADTGLIRSVPEITGVDIAYREMINTERTINFKGEQLPIKTTFSFKTENSRAEILAKDETGESVFFRHKLGKGSVYFLTLPLEKHLAEMQGAFFKDDLPDYSVIYRELAAASGIGRAADCDNKFIRFTEHIIDDNSLYIFAINYNNKTESAKLKLNGSYDIEVLFGGDFSDGIMRIGKNDGILFKAVKKN